MCVLCIYLQLSHAMFILYCAFNDFGSLLLYILLFVNGVLICNNCYYYFITGVYAITCVLLCNMHIFAYCNIILLFCGK